MGSIQQQMLTYHPLVVIIEAPVVLIQQGQYRIGYYVSPHFLGVGAIGKAKTAR